MTMASEHPAIFESREDWLLAVLRVAAKDEFIPSMVREGITMLLDRQLLEMPDE
jgi:hypothetical protein